MFRARQKLEKYRIERRLADGGFATVYQALDTVEGVRVALKVPHPQFVNAELLASFRKEVRLTARLDHPNILAIKNAGFVNGHFVIVFPLGERTLADRLRSRLSLRTALDYGEQMLRAVAYAHRRRIIHCDLKPENLILFPDNRLRLCDFGIAKVAQRTVPASGSGTVGYIAPEQAMGKPSFRSDVFSAGLILYRMLTGHLPEWPFDWPPPGYHRLRRRVHPLMIELIRRAIQVPPQGRFRDADQMLRAFRKAKSRSLAYAAARSRRARPAPHDDWRAVRRRQFLRQYGKLLAAHFRCDRCQGPVSEPMAACPWCGTTRQTHRDRTGFPARCPRCRRGLKADWHYCPWCYGPGFEVSSKRQYSDLRYQGRCSNPSCPRKLLMPFMRYCPWCHRKVRRRWMIPGSRQTCPACGWGIVRAFWDYCPWCGKPLARPAAG